VRELQAAGFEVASDGPSGRKFFQDLRSAPPHALVIDLSRLPAQGRDLAVSVRHQKATASIPLIFVGGADDRVAAVKAVIPDAVFASWDRIVEAVTAARPSPDPVRPSSVFAAYAGRPLALKLGITSGSVVALEGAPVAFEGCFEPVPQGVRIHRDPNLGRTVTLWFVRTRKDLVRDVRDVAGRCGVARLWIVWPKKSSRQGDLTQQQVREAGLAAGLVDYKVCAIDEIWSGLLFAPRRRNSGDGQRSVVP
jgi:hypothetical protein